jgi:GTPase SAR1 family protein
MAIINHAKREINAKIVYFGHEGVGKGTSLRYVYGRIKPSLRGELKVMPTAGSALLFFDFTPFEQPLFNGYRIRFQIYTLQGSVTNQAAWKMLLKGADGLVVVVDASREDLAVVRQSVVQLREVLSAYGRGLNDIPLMLQLNKADRAGRVVSAEAATQSGVAECDVHLTTATSGDGVLETLTSLSRKIMAHISSHADLPNAEQERSTDGAMSSVDAVRPVASAIGPAQSVVDSKPLPVCLSDEAPSGIEAAKEAIQQVKLVSDAASVEGSTVRIPLEIAQPGGVRRLMITVTVEPG